MNQYQFAAITVGNMKVPFIFLAPSFYDAVFTWQNSADVPFVLPVGQFQYNTMKNLLIPFIEIPVRVRLYLVAVYSIEGCNHSY